MMLVLDVKVCSTKNIAQATLQLMLIWDGRLILCYNPIEPHAKWVIAKPDIKHS